MTQNLDLTRLREVAGQATPGPWKCWNPAAGESHVSVGGKIAWRSVESATPFPEDQEIPHWADANHIATFDPPTVLALLDQVEAAEQAVARVREVHCRMPVKVNFDAQPTDFCKYCYIEDIDESEYPCPTIRALDGGEQE